MLSLFLLAAALPGQAETVPPTDAPRATSGEVASDTVGYAARMMPLPEGPLGSASIAVAHPRLPPGSFVELTALDTGRTIVAIVLGTWVGPDVVALSPGAARQLSVTERAPVRVRSVVLSAGDQATLRAGKMVEPRLDAPPPLLTALRRRLSPGAGAPQGIAAVGAPPHPAPVPSPSVPVGHRAAAVQARSPKRAPDDRLFVQIASLSSANRAAALARQVGGRVLAGAGLYRVQLGPYADPASAKRARDAIARSGYGDARILHSN